MLTLSSGLRQSLGIFVPPLTREVGISVSEFTLGVGVQNLTWGLLQPITGAAVVRWGFRPIMLLGSLTYVAAMLTLATANSLVGVVLGAGVGVGVAVSCTANAIALAVSSRVVTPEWRSAVMGMVSAGGSLGALLAAPLGQAIAQGAGWRMGLFTFAALALLMIPGAWWGGRVDQQPAIVHPPGEQPRAVQALREALSRPAFVVMSLAYFVCGMQLVFLTTHLPSYLDISGMDPMLSAQHGGELLTREKNGQLVPERAVYRVAFDVQDMPESMQSLAWRGHINIHADWASPAGRYVRQALAVLVREAGF